MASPTRKPSAGGGVLSFAFLALTRQRASRASRTLWANSCRASGAGSVVVRNSELQDTWHACARQEGLRPIWGLRSACWPRLRMTSWCAGERVGTRATVLFRRWTSSEY